MMNKIFVTVFSLHEIKFLSGNKRPLVHECFATETHQQANILFIYCFEPLWSYVTSRKEDAVMFLLKDTFIHTPPIKDDLIKPN